MKSYHFTAALLVASASSVLAVDNLWTGANSTDWNDGGNWSDPHAFGSPHVPEAGGAHPGDEDAVVNAGLMNFPIITADTIATPRDTKVGIGAGNIGRVDHRAGTHSSGATNWSFVGFDNATGRYNLADTSGVGGPLTGFAQGSGTLNSGNRLYVGDGAAGDGIFNVHTSGGVNVNEHIIIGNAGGTGIVNVDSGTVAASGEIWAGEGGGSNGTLNISGGSVTSNSWVAVGRNGSTGTINLTGTGSLEKFLSGDVNQEITVGTGAGGSGTINISDSATLTTPRMVLGENNATATGTVNQTGGTVNVTERLEVQRAGVGSYFLVAGTLQAVTIDAQDGTFDMSGTGVLQGVSNFNGDLTQAGGTVAPGTAGANAEMTIAGNYSLEAPGEIQIEIDGAGVFDSVTVTGDVSLLGNLDLVAAPGLAVNSMFTFLNNTGANPITGMFANRPGNGGVFSEDGYQWQINYDGGDGNDGVLTVIAIPEPAHLALIALSGVALIFRRRRRS